MIQTTAAVPAAIYMYSNPEFEGERISDAMFDVPVDVSYTVKLMIIKFYQTFQFGGVNFDRFFFR